MTLALVSAVLLGVYDVVKKHAVGGNAVPVVLWLSSLVGAAIWVTLLSVQTWGGGSWLPRWLHVDPLTWTDHACLACKSVLVGCSWTASLFALKHLPLSIAAPIRSTSPMWAITIAIVFLGERPTLWQWLGIAVVLVSFWQFSRVGRVEGIRFTRDRWVGWMVLATLLGSISSIFDKMLLQGMGYSPATVQAWFTVYMVPVMTPLVVFWWVGRRRARKMQRNEQVAAPERPPAASGGAEFHWRASIAWISPILLVADLVYFTALADPDALVSVVSTLRRCSVVVALAVGAKRLGEVNLRGKAWCVAGILAGVGLVLLGG